MASLLSNLVNSLSERIHKIKYNEKHEKNLKLAELIIDIATVFLNLQTLKMI